jgi:hypothetical protein
LLHHFHLTASQAARGMGSEAQLLGQSERRSRRGASRRDGLLRMRKHPTRPKRSDREVGNTPTRGSPRSGRSHFERFPLMSGKRLDFERFASVCRLMASGAHRDRTGLVDIVELVRGMNPSGRRRYGAEGILASLRQGEGIVCASGNRGITRSSDLHEWRNDLGAVSTRDPVKL